MGLFAPSELFALMAVAAHGDLDLPDGVHLRVMPSPALGFPLAPFAIYQLTPTRVAPQALWRDRNGHSVAGPPVDPSGGELTVDILPPDAEGYARDVAVELVTSGNFQGSIALIDRVGNRVFSRRSRAPFIVGGPRVDRIRISGHGQVTGLMVWRVDRRVLEQLSRPVALLSLPLQGSRSWYAGGLGADHSLSEVKRSAPRRLQLPDRPDGPLDPLTTADELARVSVFAADISAQCETMVGDLKVAPGQQRRQRHLAATPAKRQQFIDISIANTLLAQAMDPGIGRYLGLVGALDSDAPVGSPLAYGVLGLFAFSRQTVLPDGRRIDLALGSPPAVMQALETQFVNQVKAGDVLAKLNEYYNDRPQDSPLLAYLFGLESRVLLAAAGAVPPPDPPQLPSPMFGNSQWLDGNGRPSTSFRQEFLFPDAPLGSLVALGRSEEAVWTTRHQTFDLAPPANPGKRALAMLMGHTQIKPKISALLPKLAGYMRRGLISDTPIPASLPPVSYRAALADMFGRFGQPAQFDVPAPPRPRPPLPAPQATLVLDGPDSVGGPPASPGHIEVAVSVPPVWALAAGSLDITSLELAFNAAPLAPIPIDVSADPQVVSANIPLPPLAVAESQAGLLTAAFVDSAGVRSDTAQLSVKFTDRRRPAVIPTGIGIIWTSRPGPSPEVELKLQWLAKDSTQYRVYIADEKSLGLAGASRAEVAVQGGQRDKAHTLGGRERFRLLTDPPLLPTSGMAQLSERLPRSLGTVQFLRIVPLTADGREAEFDSCGVVAVAVPTDRSPVQPRLEVSVNAATHIATVTIEAVGLDLVELQASEPGLFAEPPQPGAVAPEFRLRRASGSVTDPIYAREIARGPLHLERDGANIVFKAQLDDPSPLTPFIHYSYWAEVRMPAERRLSPGIIEVPPADGVMPVIPEQVADMPRPFSRASAPMTALCIPDAPVPTLAGATVKVITGAGTVQAILAAPSTPSASPKGIGPYQLQIWEQWGSDQPIQTSSSITLDGSPLSWKGTLEPVDAHPRPLTLWLVTVDPAGRQSDVISVPES